MARPPKEGLDYFPHDTDAADDEKIEALRALYGNDGYAFYFILLERIYRTRGSEIDISDAEMRQILSRKVGVDPDQFDQMLQTALRWGCFDRAAYEERGVLTSGGIKRRAAVVVEKREKMRNRYRGNKGVSDAETREETREETGEETGVSAEFHFRAKEKKSKEKHVHDAHEVTLTCNKVHGQNLEASAAEAAGNPFDFSEDNPNPGNGQSTNPDAGEAYRLFEREYGRPLSPIETEQVLSMVDASGLELVREALRRAIVLGKRNLRYTERILEQWAVAGVKTLAEALEYEAEYERKHRRQTGARPTRADPNRDRTKERELIRQLYET